MGVCIISGREYDLTDSAGVCIRFVAQRDRYREKLVLVPRPSFFAGYYAIRQSIDPEIVSDGLDRGYFQSFVDVSEKMSEVGGVA